MKAYFYRNVFTFDYQKIEDYVFEELDRLDMYTAQRYIDEMELVTRKELTLEETLKLINDSTILLEAR